MGKIVGGMATSHAFAFMDPDDWDGFRERNRDSYLRRRGVEAPVQPGVTSETLAGNKARYERIRDAHAALRRQIEDERPDTIVVVGDDQNEVFDERNIPQLAIYTGGDFTLSSRHCRSTARYRTDGALAETLLESGVRDGYDIARLGAFTDDELASHAHAQVLEALLPAADLAVVPVFVNAIHTPAIEPARCYAFGRMIRDAIERDEAIGRVIVCASGGLSHFTAGYPWARYDGPFDHGAICEDFDHTTLAAIEAGQGRRLAAHSSAELLRHGEVELRTWITLLGALGDVPSRFTVYEPFYRAIMGIAVASWPAAATN